MSKIKELTRTYMSNIGYFVTRMLFIEKKLYQPNDPFYLLN